MNEFLQSFTKLEFDKVRKYIQRYATSDLGKEHLENLSPSSSLLEIKANLGLVSEMKRLLESNEPLPLDGIPDIRVALQRSSIENFALPAADLHQISRALNTAQRISSYFNRKKDDFPLLGELVSPIQFHKVLAFNIDQAIDDEGVVKSSASKELKQIRGEIGEKSVLLQKRLESILKSVAEKDWIQDEIVTTRDFRMVIPVKSEHKNRVPGFIHSASGSGATVFIEPTETLELNNDIRTLQFREQREIERILKGLTDQVREVRVELLEDVRLLAEVDFIYAKGKYSIEVLGIEPAFLDGKGVLRLRGGRHPILLQKHKRAETIPLDLDLPEDITTVLISGPNAGGKSVAIKTVGLLSILAQSGCHIPASEGTILKLFSDIFVDMGDEQSIENDLSSFSSHLKNLKELIENVNKTSLVLIDEIGSGTDPMEGAAIASAVLKRLTEVGCTSVVTTHHGTLKSFAHQTAGIENAGMEFDQATLMPTYRLVMGIPGSSYAMEMAERIGFPSNVVQDAKEIRGTDAYNLDKLLIELQEHTQKAKAELERAEQEHVRSSGLAKEYEDKIASLRKDLKQIKQNAIEEAREIVSKANTAVERTIREIRENSTDRQFIRTARTELKSLEKEIIKSKDDVEVIDASRTEFTKGDSVRLKSSNSTGEVAEKIGSNQYMVILGNLKVKASAKDLELIATKVPTYSKREHYLEQSEVKREVDLRGMYGDEAIQAIEKLFDDAMLAGLNRVDLIHGKGTGALRKRVTEFLKNNKSVKSYRLGEWNEGGTGVTVVELK